MNLDAMTWKALHSQFSIGITYEAAQKLSENKNVSVVFSVARAIARAIDQFSDDAKQQASFVRLCREVSAVDSEAAQWLEIWLPVWAQYNYCDLNLHATNFIDLMIWGCTPQGPDYWAGIDRLMAQTRCATESHASNFPEPYTPYYDELRANRTARELALSLRQEVRSMLHSGGWYDDE